MVELCVAVSSQIGSLVALVGVWLSEISYDYRLLWLGMVSMTTRTATTLLASLALGTPQMY